MDCYGESTYRKKNMLQKYHLLDVKGRMTTLKEKPLCKIKIKIKHDTIMKKKMKRKQIHMFSQPKISKLDNSR